MRFELKPGTLEMDIEGQNRLNNQREDEIQNRHRNREANTISKKELKTKIGSRQDFVMIFGFDRCLKSWLLSPPQKIHILAIHHRHIRGPQTSGPAKCSQSVNCAPKGEGLND